MKRYGETLYVTAVEDSDRLLCYFWCPGCDSAHNYWVQNPEMPISQTTVWEWNGDIDKPTFSPSLLLHPHPTIIDSTLEGDALVAAENITETPRCHLFITDGVIEFLSDCTHALAGQPVRKVPMVPLPDWMREGHFVGPDED